MIKIEVHSDSDADENLDQVSVQLTSRLNSNLTKKIGVEPKSHQTEAIWIGVVL